MIIALDINDHRTLASNAHRDNHYYCQQCGEELVLRKGEARRPHFSHKSGSGCEYSTNKTEWHYEWQESFRLVNAEKMLAQGKYKHIADIQIGDTVIEFQHSNISDADIAERNHFYSVYGLKTVWIFDIRNDLCDKKIHCYKKRPGYNWLFEWERPKSSVLRALETSPPARVFLQVTDNWLLEVTWYPNGHYERDGWRKKSYHSEGDYWCSIRRFAANVMDKEHTIETIKEQINEEYEPKVDHELFWMFEEHLPLYRNGTIG